MTTLCRSIGWTRAFALALVSSALMIGSARADVSPGDKINASNVER